MRPRFEPADGEEEEDIAAADVSRGKVGAMAGDRNGRQNRKGSELLSERDTGRQRQDEDEVGTGESKTGQARRMRSDAKDLALNQ